LPSPIKLRKYARANNREQLILLSNTLTTAFPHAERAPIYSVHLLCSQKKKGFGIDAIGQDHGFYFILFALFFFALLHTGRSSE
jgi:hypothetical protein